MRQSVLGHPIQGASDPIDELATQFVVAAREQAAAFVEVRRLESELDELNVKSERLAGAADGAKSDLDAARAEVESCGALKASPMAFKSLPATGWGLIVCLWLPLGFLPAEPNAIRNYVVLVGIATMGVTWLLSRSNKNKLLEAAKKELRRAEQSHNGAAGELAASRKNRDALAKRIESQRPTKPAVSGIGRIYLPYERVEMAGKSVIVDRSGLSGSAEIRMPDLATNPDTLKSVRATIEGAKGMPVLLRPAEEGQSELESLQGEESELKAAVEDFTDMVCAVPVHSVELPLVNKSSSTAQAFGADEAKTEATISPGVIIRDANASQTDAAVDRVNEVAERMRAVGSDVDKALTSCFGELQQTLDRYSELRSDALHSLHTHLVGAMERSSMLSVYYFCPKCNRVPEYLYWVLGVRLEDAHLSNQAELLTRMMDVPEIEQRLQREQGIVHQLAQAHRSLAELHAELDALESRMAASSTAVGADVDLASVQSSKARQKAFASQYDEMLREYRAVIRLAVTGSKRDAFDFSHEARLYLDPVHRNWTCEACQTTYDDPEVSNMGRILKAKADLMMPMWNALWTEKEDFRKSEIFRTNEAIQRMTEKESEKLIDVSNQYKADMRPVRENLVRYSGEAESKQEQLYDTLTSLQDIGLLDVEKAKSVREQMQGLLGDKIATYKRSAESKELLLNLEPQAQVQRRPTSRDPIDFFLSPSALFRQVTADYRVSSVYRQERAIADQAASALESSAEGGSDVGK